MAPVPEAAVAAVSQLTNHVTNFVSSQLLRRSTSSSLSSPLLPRDDSDSSSTYTAGQGVTSPTSIPNNAIFALFGLIGAGFVITGIWFFFWAKNGGFHFRKGDWEEYKSTVLRRKGPNGTTLSNATPSTDLGGGSIVGKRYRDFPEGSSIGTESEMSEIKKGKGARGAQKARKQRDRKRGKGEMKERRRATGAARDEEESVGIQEQEPEEAIRAYRHEKPARVGGLNRVPDGSSFEGSSHDSHSDLLSNRQPTPTTTPTKKLRKDTYTGGTGTSPGIRKVESMNHGRNASGSGGFWSSSRNSAKKDNDAERIKAEAKKLQEKGRQAASGGGSSGRRDFSYSAGDDGASPSRRDSPRVPGSYAESDIGSEVGTKSYHHPIPGLSDYAEERRRARAAGAGKKGYRRGRSDSEGI